MSFSTIQVKQKIKSVNLSEIPEILKSEYKKALSVESAEGMTFFYLIDSDEIIMNRSNPNHEFLSLLVTNYMCFDEVTKSEFKEQMPYRLSDTIATLDAIVNLRNAS